MKPIAKRLTMTAGAIVVCALAITPAFAAESARDIVAEWFSDLENAGAEVARYSAIATDPATGRLSINDISIRHRITFDLFGQLTVDFTVTAKADSVTLDGLERTAQGYRARNITAAEGTSLALLSNTNEIPFEVEAIYDGMEASAVAWSRFPQLAHDPERPFAGFFSVARAIVNTEYDRWQVARILVTQGLPDGGTQTATYEDVRQTGMTNGKLASYEIGHFESIQIIPLPEASTTTRVTVETGRQSGRNLDLLGIVESLDPASNRPTSQDATGILETASVEDIRVSADEFNLGIERVAVDGVSFSGSASTLVTLLERQVLGKKVEEEALVTAAAGYAGAIGLKRMEIRGLQGDGDDVEDLDIRRIEIADISSNGIGSFIAEGVSIHDATSAGVKLGRFVLADLHFPPLQAILKLQNKKNTQDIQAVLRAMPKLGRVEIDDLRVRDGKYDGDASLGHFELLQSAYINTIPTDIRTRISNFRIPLALVDDADAQELLSAIGLSEIRLDQNVALRWNADTEDLELERSEVRLENGGRGSLRIRLGGLPRSVLEDPNLAQMALATLSIKEAEFLIEDAVGLTRFIDVQAQEADISPELMRAGLVEVMTEDLGPLAQTRFGKELKAALLEFAGDPRRLSIRLEPKQPVLLVQAIGLMASAPQVLLDTLGASAQAN